MKKIKLINKKSLIVLLIIAFVIVVTVYFVILKIGKSTIELRPLNNNTNVQMASDLEERLPFADELDRFLYVYFNQQFEQKEDFINFVTVEYRRFSFFPVESGVQKEWKSKLVSSLSSIIKKSEQGISDYREEELILRSLQGEM